MKNIFQCKTLWGMAILIFLIIGGDKKIKNILTTFEITAREALELAGGATAIVGAGYARYKGDKTVYTPKILPGANKAHIVWDVDDIDETSDVDESPFVEID